MDDLSLSLLTFKEGPALRLAVARLLALGDVDIRDAASELPEPTRSAVLGVLRELEGDA